MIILPFVRDSQMTNHHNYQVINFQPPELADNRRLTSFLFLNVKTLALYQILKFRNYSQLQFIMNLASASRHHEWGARLLTDYFNAIEYFHIIGFKTTVNPTYDSFSHKKLKLIAFTIDCD